MNRLLTAVALLLSFSVAVAAQEKPHPAKSNPNAVVLEARVNKLWEAFKKKDKASLSALIDDNFRQFEEGLSAFADKKAEVNAVDEYELISYKLTDFNVRSLGPNTALVTYIADYQGKSGGEVSKAKSVFGEVWVRSGDEWKALYMQETYMK
jgi:hypothetical protein